MKKATIQQPRSYVEITKESGEVIDRQEFNLETMAHDQFEKIETIRWPETYKGWTMNLSEFFNGGNIGSVRVVVETASGTRLIRRELWRCA